MHKEKRIAVMVSCSDHYHNRMYLFDTLLQSQGYRTQYVTSDFHHTQKRVFRCDVPGAVQLSVRPYQKNLSADRILSHRDFARRVLDHLEALPQTPDMVVCELPPNFLARYLAKYKRRHPEVKLVFDIFDLWPETFPFGKAKRLLSPIFSVWGSLRDRALPIADRVLTECDLFREKLGLTQDPRSRTIYLAGIYDPALCYEAKLPEDHLSLCYLGAINNIIDIPRIAELVRGLLEYRPVSVHVIGKGERLEEFLSALKETGAQVTYHGAIYDAREKQEIIARCHFGLNIMKSSVCIGLTMKSVDYWSHELPIINNIPADSAFLVEKCNVGVNLTADTAREIGQMSQAHMLEMRRCVRQMFHERMTEAVIQERLTEALKEIL